eukprot:2001854-Rhodomonas_salina.1
MERWIVAAFKQKQLRTVTHKVAVRWARILAVRAIVSWRDAVSEHAHQRDLLKKAVLKMMGGALAGAMDRWREMAIDSQRLRAVGEKAVTRGRGQQLQMVLERWKEAVEVMVKQELLLRDAVLRIKSLQLAKGLLGWLAAVKRQRRARVVCSRTANKWRRVLASKA